MQCTTFNNVLAHINVSNEYKVFRYHISIVIHKNNLINGLSDCFV